MLMFFEGHLQKNLQPGPLEVLLLIIYFSKKIIRPLLINTFREFQITKLLDMLQCNLKCSLLFCIITCVITKSKFEISKHAVVEISHILEKYFINQINKD